MLLGLLPGFGLEVAVVGRALLAQAAGEGGVVESRAEVEQLGSIVIVFFVFVKLGLAEHEDFGVSAHIAALMLVSPAGLLHPQTHPFLRTVLLPLPRHHPLLYLLIPPQLRLLLPLFRSVYQV